MKREPSIHVTATKFNEMWEKLGGYKLSDDFIGKLFRMAKGYSLDHRSVLVKSQRDAKKVMPRVSSSNRDANLAADIIYSVRVKLKHVGVTKIKQTDNQWPKLKELVPIINDFCNNFGFKKREGYIAFIETGISLMGSTKRPNYGYAANWMISKADWILDKFETTKLINDDKYPQETQQVHDIYRNKILSMTGISNNYMNDPVEYVNFLKARETADRLGVDYETFIEAQFSALEFCNGIPKLEDLWNDKAVQRLTKYMSQNGLVLGTISNNDKSLWDSFKQ